jgi:hypothetical protein
MISHRHQCIFVHIPKTGGTSIDSLLWPDIRKRTTTELWMGFKDKYHNKYQTGGLQHLHADQIKSEVGSEIFNGYFKFSIVRNPWDKAVSQFRYMAKRDDLREYLGMKPNDCFKRYLELISKKTHVQWEPQVRFVLDDAGNSMVDYIGRFESFTESVGTVMNRIGLDVSKIPHANKSRRSATQDEYDSESREIVGTLYAEDVKAFGYDSARPHISTPTRSDTRQNAGLTQQTTVGFLRRLLGIATHP